MLNVIYSVSPQVMHFVRALGENPGLILIALLTGGSAVFSACFNAAQGKTEFRKFD